MFSKVIDAGMKFGEGRIREIDGSIFRLVE